MYDFSREKINYIKSDLKNKLSSKRYEHTLGVSYISSALAMCYKEDIIKAELAGVLHDIAKSIKMSELKRLMAGFDDPYTDVVYVENVRDNAPQILHAVYAPYLAKKDYNIEDKDILSAIRWHTTGKKEMSMLEKIVFVADYIEPNRKDIPDLNVIRTLAFKDITKAVKKIANATIIYLNSQNVPVDKFTYELSDIEV